MRNIVSSHRKEAEEKGGGATLEEEETAGATTRGSRVQPTTPEDLERFTLQRKIDE